VGWPSAVAKLPTSPTSDPLTLQLSVFEDLWQTVQDEYLYRDFNGLDWDAVYDEYRGKIEAGLSEVDFYAALDEMIFRLGDEHSYFLDPQAVIEEDAEYAGSMDYVGIGVLLSAVPERQRAVIVVVFAGGPAEQAGLQPRDSILSADGQPILDENGYLRSELVRGVEGTQVTLKVQTPGQAPRDLTLTRRRITGNTPVPYTVLTSPQGKHMGYIFLASFSDVTIDDQVGDALRAMTADAPLDGLIIDNRHNGGGSDEVVIGALAYLTSGVMGHFVDPRDSYPLEVPDADDIDGSQDVPLVVLVGEGTASFGEIFSGILQDLGRAYLIGQTTDGNVELLWGFDFEDGSRLWLAHETFRPLNHPEANWEETGIIPDQTVIANWDEHTLETDPVILAALAHLDMGGR
jgi:C-terminal peptidase prc